MGEIPLMTDNGTFVINGTEEGYHQAAAGRYSSTVIRVTSSGRKILYNARVNRHRGSSFEL